jgi:hypothetical protein
LPWDEDDFSGMDRGNPLTMIRGNWHRF